jgi:zeaxanthin glucosyltransferase
VNKRILFTAIPEKGHLNPMIGPAVHLQRRGHVVTFHAAGDISRQLSRAGLSTLGSASESSVTPEPHDANRGERFARHVRDPQWLRGWIKALLVDAAEAQVEPMREVIRAFEPDAIVTDPMIYAAAIAAHLEGVPWFALSNSLNPVLDDSIMSDLLETVRWLSPDRESLFRRHGMELRFSGCDMISPKLTIAFTTREFVGRKVQDVRLVGPSIPPGVRGDEEDFAWDRLRPGRPLVYLSFGSQIYHQPEIFRLVIEATSGLGVQLLIVANELHHSSLLGDLPDHVFTCHYAPQLALLAKAQAFVTHGGANSVMEAMHFGVPLLISPVCNDQFHQSHFIRRNGIGRILDLGSATVEECLAALRALLYDKEILGAVARMAHSYQRDGAAAAADLIERHA